MAKEKVLITVKTYPTLSATYGELVCTAGVTEDGTWVRIYPVPYRKNLDFSQQYKKYQWIELDLEKNPKDFRPETYRPRDIRDISLLNFVGTKNAWAERKSLILEKNKIFKNLSELIKEAKTTDLSLAIFKPTKIKGFRIEKTSGEWDPEKLREAEAQGKQLNLIDGPEKLFKKIPKIPFKFKYFFEDETGTTSNMMIEDWEIGQLYLNCLKENTPEIAAQKVKQKYFDEFTKKNDVYFFLGTTFLNHKRAPNPFLIIGVFYPLIEKEPLLF